MSAGIQTQAASGQPYGAPSGQSSKQWLRIRAPSTSPFFVECGGLHCQCSISVRTRKARESYRQEIRSHSPIDAKPFW